MTIKRRASAAAAALTIVTGLLAAGAIPASAATPQCGGDCGSVFSRELGTYEDGPGVVEAVLNGVARVGQPVVLSQASNSDPAEDIVPHGASVSDWYAAGLVSAEVNRHYAGLVGVQQEYAPYGDETGLCVGLARAPRQNDQLTLQPCSVSARTIWILDPSTRYFTIVNGATATFDRPFAMDLRRDEIAGERKTLHIRVRRLEYHGEDKTVPNTQLWGFLPGVLN